MKQHKIRVNGNAYEMLRRHLFTGDGLEAVAFALCGKLSTDEEEVYTVHKVVLYPHEKCTVRKVDRVEWSPTEIVNLFEECRKNNLTLLKVHCHPGYWPYFSEVDDASDRLLSDTLTGWTDRNDNVVSVIMLPDGSLFGRAITDQQTFIDINNIIVVGNDIQCFQHAVVTGSSGHDDLLSEVDLRTRQAFGPGTTQILKSLKVGVVGCSGTGSIAAELLGRLGVGKLTLVDFDKVEHKNLNRILNATFCDAEAGTHKVDVLKRTIEQMGTGVEVRAISENLHSYDAYQAIAACDIVVGCMDTIDGRHLLNRIATYFCSAYFDVGVRLDADGNGGIREILGRVDYLQPGGSSLLTRSRYDLEQLNAADMARTNPEEFARQVKEGYIKSANVSSPAVISINMMFASQAITEILARLHPFRDLSNKKYAAISFSVSGFLLIPESDGEPDMELLAKVGMGTVKPLLGSPTLIEKK